MRRRVVLSAAASAIACPQVFAQSARPGAGDIRPRKAPLLDMLRIVIPANPGGGWDQTGRSLGEAMQAAGLVGQVLFENVGGKAGVVGLAHFVQKYNATPHTVLVGGMVMLGGIAVHRPAVDLSQVVPLAQLTTDYLVVAVPAGSRIQNVQALARHLSDADFSATVAGGSAGGVDHMLLGMMLRATSGRQENFTYLATSSGLEAARALQEGRAQIGISGLSEFAEPIANGTLRALAISARKGRDGLPSLREGGIATDMANWRGLFAPRGLPAPALGALQGLVEQTARSAQWAQRLQANRWIAAYRASDEFRGIVETEQVTARVVAHLLKLRG